MKNLFCLIVFVSICSIGVSQNLVPNGDFEQYTTCPVAYSQLSSVSFWMNPAAYFNASPDYYNQCSTNSMVDVPVNWGGTSYQNAHSGVAYAGIYLYLETTPENREYIEAPLTSSLIADSCYHFQMYINLADACQYTTDDIGVYFSSIPITGVANNVALPFTPQLINTAGNFPDSLNWTLVEGDYTAIGGESHLIIGNFKNDSTTNFVLVNNGGTGISAYSFIDDVSLILIPSCQTGVNENESIYTKVFPNPFSTTLTFESNSNEISEIILYDISSRKILQQEFVNTVSLSTEWLSKGLYLYELRNKNGLDSYRVIKNGMVVKD